ncbi:hypothetical protein SDC9_205207 [bioreactor metagenome]|uniref:Uncharacterized protein n=1 Tax=bioreactor metagenome TaxID=1076179 RepID=A0A645JD81_9ZZZZ
MQTFPRQFKPCTKQYHNEGDHPQVASDSNERGIKKIEQLGTQQGSHGQHAHQRGDVHPTQKVIGKKTEYDKFGKTESHTTPPQPTDGRFLSRIAGVISKAR